MLPDMPIPTAGATACIAGSDIFVCGGECNDSQNERVVQQFNLEDGKWNTLPPAPHYNCHATVINGHLTLIGGRDSETRRVTRQLSTFIEHKWKTVYPPMPTERREPSVLYHDNFLIVAGGLICLNTDSIDVMNTSTKDWIQPRHLTLPQPLSYHQMTLCKDRLYVFSCLNSKLWSIPIINITQTVNNEEISTVIKWKEGRPLFLPYFYSSILQTSVLPMVIDQISNDILVYDATQDKWIKVGKCSVHQSLATSLSISPESFIVLGGISNIDRKQLSSVELLKIN